VNGYPFCPECGCDWSIQGTGCTNPACNSYEGENYIEEGVDEGGEG
jgi:hypothetical protein